MSVSAFPTPKIWRKISPFWSTAPWGSTLRILVESFVRLDLPGFTTCMAGSSIGQIRVSHWRRPDCLRTRSIPIPELGAFGCSGGKKCISVGTVLAETQFQVHVFLSLPYEMPSVFVACFSALFVLILPKFKLGRRGNNTAKPSAMGPAGKGPCQLRWQGGLSGIYSG